MASISVACTRPPDTTPPDTTPPDTTPPVTPPPADIQTIFTSGNARFEVLSPTLLRTEYAGDARFFDTSTFNVIGRAGFVKTRSTTRTEDGWLVIDTGALTLRYEVGSGPFTDKNLLVRLKAGAQDIEGRPWASRVLPTCALGALCEAEDLVLEGVSEAREHGGFTGTGFAAGFEGTGTRVTFQVSPEAGAYVLDLRYANGFTNPRTLTLTVDGGSARQLTLPPSGNWATWGHVSLPLDLTAGPHVVALTRTRSDTGQLNIDSLALLKSGDAYPRAPKLCGFGERCEAEDLALSGRMHLATDHPDYSGRGFAAGFEGVGDSIGFDLDAPAAGDYELTARYANGFTSQAGVTLTVEGGASTPFALPSTGGWGTWKTATVPVHLAAGMNHVTLVRQASDAGNVNLDSLAIGPAGTGLPAPVRKTGKDCGFGRLCEAESVGLSGGARTARDHNGYSGKGFAAGLDVTGSQLTVRAVDVPAQGTYSLQLRYTRGLKTSGAVTVQVGTDAASPLTLAPTSDWDSWRTVRMDVTLPSGTSDVLLSCPRSGGCGINVDTVALTKTDTPLLVPHAALGGYRRGLDGFDGNNNGNPILNPGLLYQDGWSLLDDTASAEYDPASRKLTPRPAHPGGYQDGYVFGYGRDYPRALDDLAKLTGPSKLLPRWAYGVWFSEYLDLTAADFQNGLLPTFRKEGVPLDVLVVDTDFKAGNAWNGWDIDTSEFPDPKGFFDWARAQGLHTTLNIHPSILPTDPRFTAAQETARGKLTQHLGACSGGASECYTFDFGDTDQLKAFFGLHDTMKQQGTDFWWLDWCCDASEANVDGVTGDAWINQQYADYTDASIGRGFAFSRAFGSLQAGGYSNPTALPTGPWADKRTTLPFTGDTLSTWGTLASEVGFTSGEGVATGLSAISHDIGGHNGGLWGLPGADVVKGQRTDKLPDDLYARWVQFGTFQPIDRLHSNHGDRLPWQYPGAAGESAKKFLNLREALVPYTYTLAREAEATGIPVVRPTYLTYPAEQDAYATAGGEYLYGADVLVAPVTTPGSTATTPVWFPPGSSWTDWFTGKTYAGGTLQNITNGLDTMPVFVRSGGIVPTRGKDVINDVQSPLDAVTLTVAAGAKGQASLFEDDGTTSNRQQSTRTSFRYTEDGPRAALRIDSPEGSFAGQVQKRAWTVRFLGAKEPGSVTLDGQAAPAGSWTWDAASSVLTVKVAERPTSQAVDVAYQAR